MGPPQSTTTATDFDGKECQKIPANFCMLFFIVVKKTYLFTKNIPRDFLFLILFSTKLRKYSFVEIQFIKINFCHFKKTKVALHILN